MVEWSLRRTWVCLALVCLPLVSTGEPLRIATYNLESYLDVATATRPAKSVEARRRISENLVRLRADVLTLQEIGSASALLELHDSLKTGGLELPHSLMITGSDTNIHMALLSRFSFGRVQLFTNESFLSHGRRFHVSRGFARVEIKVNASYSFTLIAAHLKSKRPLPGGDEEEIRFEEAKLLRDKVDQCLAEDPRINLVVIGDFNDTIDSPTLKAIMGRGTARLVDTRPSERLGEADSNGLLSPGKRRVTWTHFYAPQDSYQRIDFILVSRGMAKEWISAGSYVLAVPGWGDASDHRPVVAEFQAEDR